jgi:quinol monooxygenase YgiN
MKIIAGLWKIKPGHKQQFIERSIKAVHLSSKEEGCITFLFTESKSEENVFLFFEEWRDQAAIDFHVAQLYFKEFMEKVQPMLAAPAKIKIYNVDNVTEL